VYGRHRRAPKGQFLIDTRYVDVSCHAASSTSCTDTFGMYNNMATTAHTHKLEKLLNTPDKQLVTVSILLLYISRMITHYRARDRIVEPYEELYAC